LEAVSRFRIRPASREDLEAIVAFNVALARESESLELDPRVVRRGVEAVLRDPHKGQYWILEADRPIGQALVTREWSDWRAGYFWWLQSLYIVPDWRGRGLFSALLDRILEAARTSAEVCALRLYVHERNGSAMGIYEHLGFYRTAYALYERDLL
jgi:GNAT superfamily N-acetyltransferase